MKTLYSLTNETNLNISVVYSLEVDGTTLPFQPGKLVLLGARSGMGRTLLMLYFFLHLYEKYDEPQCFVSNEEDVEDLLHKLQNTVKGNPMFNNQIDSAPETFAGVLHSEKSFMHYSHNTWELLKMKLEEVLAMQPIRFLFIDKVQGLFSEERFRNRDQELSHILNEMKKFAQEHHMCLILSSSLNRSVESREGKQPALSDLRDTGSLEDLADVVLFLSRPEYYGITEDEEGNSLRGMAEVSMAKNRMGKKAKARFMFHSETGCFSPFAEQARFSYNQVFNKMVETFDLTDEPF
jgi:replicative DNA helicase